MYIYLVVLCAVHHVYLFGHFVRCASCIFIWLNKCLFKCKKGVDQVSDSCDSYALTISIKKTEVVYHPAPGKPYKEPTITVKGHRLQVVDKFTYLVLEAHCLELGTLMMKSMLELPKLVQHLAGYVEVFGTKVESDLTQS